MKKIILLFTFLVFSVLGYSQVETFEGGIPSTWAVMNGTNGLGNLQPWILNTTPWPTPTSPRSPFPAHNDPTDVLNAAYVNNEQIGQGNTEEDWLIMNQRTIPTNGQLRFWTRLTLLGDQGTIYEIRVSTNPTQTNQAAYTVLKSWDENTMIDSTKPIAEYQEVTVNFPAAMYGQNVYVAFVRKFTQPTGARGGDRWLIDDVNIVERCLDPSGLDVIPASIASTSVTLQWNNPSLATHFELEVIPAADTPTGTGTIIVTPNTATVNYNQAGLLPGQTYKYYVRSLCGTAPDYIPSAWAGPFIFTTLPLGSVCADPIVITLPYQVLNSNTAPYGDEVDVQQATGCGTVTPANANYLQGNEVFYSYTNSQAEDVTISVVMNPIGATSTNSSVFVYDGCIGNGGICKGGVANAGLVTRSFTFLAQAGHTYSIIVSSSTTQTIAYGLLVQEVKCTPAPASLNADNITTTSAHLFWDGQTYSAWQVAVQPLGSVVPSGAGVDVSTASYDATLLPATQYQYWVRAECAPGTGIYTAWAGPYVFNTLVCNPSETCNYTFRLANTTANGWGATRMLVRQNGILIATLGTQITNAGPVDVTVPLCPNVPFDLFWSVAGAAPQQRIVTILNKFGQTIYTKPAGTGAANTVLYTDTVNCDTPRCDIPPTNVAIAAGSITTTGATITWDAVATTSWDIYVTPKGSPAPDASTTPTYDDISPATTSFATTIPLLPDHCYDVYVRVNCSPNPSLWSNLTTASTFCTLPTCFKPTNAVVVTTSITTTSATFTWDPGNAANTQFEILLIPGPDAPSPLPDNGTASNYPIITIPAGGPYTTSVTNLLPATIYYAYIRSVCSPTDSSTWTPFPVFNTVTCADADKCNYKFVLTNTTGNSWNNGRMQVRQNGIVVATLGANLINNQGGVVVPLCNGVPFDLFWSVPGTQPAQIGVSIQNPFLDVLYTKAPGAGTPGTILYASTGNCVPAPCSKPTNITVLGTTATTATVGWTDISVPTAPNYAIYYVETGGAAPINDPATPATISPVTNPYTITGLDPSKSYTFYVKSLCSASESSTWTVLSPIIFVTTPLNNQCADATLVTVNPGQVCLTPNTVPGNTYGANANADDAPPGGVGACGTTDDDIWFKFVATATSHTINFSNIVGTPTSAKINHSVYSGSCGNFTQLYCSASTTSSTATGLVPGDTYYIRVYTLGNLLTQYVKFDLCITSPPANDECVNAANVPVSPQWECDPTLFTPGSTLGASPSSPAVTGTGCAGTDDDVWFSFVAASNIQIININDIVKSTSAVTLNHALLSGPCDNLVNIYCNTTSQSVATGLTVGATYYIRVYTQGTTAGQSATFNMCVSTPPPPATNDECASAINVPVNELSECNLLTHGNLIGATGSTNPIGNGTPTCQAGANDDVWFTFVANSGTEIVSLLNIDGTTTNLNHAIYSGSCAGLTRINCSDANSLQTINKNLVVGNTYYIRVWSNSTASQVVQFDVCVKPVSSCQNAAPFCGSSLENPYIYSNTTGLPDTSQVACLGSIPNPTYYTLHVDQTGTLVFNILQYDDFDAAGNPIGNVHDVDFAAWGPFTSTDACNQISFTDCPTCPFDNFPPTNNTFYPFGNIIDCSYSTSNSETLTIPNAVAGQYYIVLVTNFSNLPGKIRLVQTNFGQTDAGSTVCCDVKLGPDISVCAESVTLNALEDVVDLNNVPATFLWYFNGSTSPILGPDGNPVTTSTISVTQSGTYTVKGNCGLNPVSDDINVILGPVIQAVSPNDYLVCDEAPNDGLALFDLTTLTPQVLANVNAADYTVTYYVDEGQANADAANTIDTSVLFPNTVPGEQTIYIRIESNTLSTCYAVVPAKLVVTPLPNAEFSYASTEYCKNNPANPSPIMVGAIGQFSAVPGGLSLNAATGEITLATSQPGQYTVTNHFDAAGGCAEVNYPFVVTITAPTVADFSYASTQYCKNGTDPAPILVAASGQFYAEPTGLSINSTTGIIDLSESAEGLYTVYNKIAAAGGCAEVLAHTEVKVTEQRNPDFTYAANQYCKDNPNTLPIFTAGEPGQFSATPAGLSINTTTGEVNVQGSTPGEYIIRNTIAAGFGCDEVFDEFTMTITALPAFDMLGGCEGNDYVVAVIPATGSFELGTVTYNWSGGNFVLGTESGTIVAKSAPTTYSVTVTTAEGCSSSNSLPVPDISCSIQKGISPNNDGKNDAFDLTTLNVKHLTIYNRYGTEVFQWDNYTKEWKGQSNSGDMLPDGTYFYVIDKADGEQKTGWVYLNR